MLGMFFCGFRSIRRIITLYYYVDVSDVFEVNFNFSHERNDRKIRLADQCYLCYLTTSFLPFFVCLLSITTINEQSLFDTSFAPPTALLAPIALR